MAGLQSPAQPSCFEGLGPQGPHRLYAYPPSTLLHTICYSTAKIIGLSSFYSFCTKILRQVIQDLTLYSLCIAFLIILSHSLQDSTPPFFTFPSLSLALASLALLRPSSLIWARLYVHKVQVCSCVLRHRGPVMCTQCHNLIQILNLIQLIPRPGPGLCCLTVYMYAYVPLV